VRVVLGRSQAHGFGVFAAEGAAAGDHVGKYVGELLPHADAHAHGRVYVAIGVSFLYTLTRTLVLDATRVGGSLRYINLKRDGANLTPKLLSVCGYIRVGFFAAQDLVPGEALFFDYGYILDDWRVSLGCSACWCSLVTRRAVTPASAASASARRTTPSTLHVGDRVRVAQSATRVALLVGFGAGRVLHLVGDAAGGDAGVGGVRVGAVDNAVDVAVLATASATHSRRDGLRCSSALAPAVCCTWLATLRAVTQASALAACSTWLASAHRVVISDATVGACAPPPLPCVTRTTGGMRSTGWDAHGQSDAEEPSDACECGRTCSNGRGPGNGRRAVDVLVYCLGAVYFVGADPLAGVCVLEVGEVHASCWRAAATHVRLAVVHRPGASSWDAGDADVCVKHDAFVLMR